LINKLCEKYYVDEGYTRAKQVEKYDFIFLLLDREYVFSGNYMRPTGFSYFQFLYILECFIGHENRLRKQNPMIHS